MLTLKSFKRTLKFQGRYGEPATGFDHDASHFKGPAPKGGASRRGSAAHKKRKTVEVRRSMKDGELTYQQV